jgi:uncharacterized protein (DUF362 family)/NAD-dependent dihydropyrimidine dehydrogenase PreA subunit
MSKVVVIKCNTYDSSNIKPKIEDALALLGGIESIIPKNKKILLKPNLVVGVDKDQAVTTHPAVFESIIQILKDKDYNLSYGDSPGLGKPDKVAAKAGLKDIADSYQVPLADFNDGYQVHLPDSTVCKQFTIVNAMKDHQAIINLPKMKSHALQRITGAIKNPFGMVLGYNKATMHARYTNAFLFAEMLIDLNTFLKVDLHIMDGIVAMEGNGPRNGNPTPMNVILISTDPVALDATFCKLINIDPRIIPAITYGQERGLGTYEDITLLGDPIEDLINPNFDIPKTQLKVEDSSKFDLLKPLIRRPYIIEDKCKQCGICVEVCPLEQKALSFEKGKDVTPKYDYQECIRCYCCQEMCPHHAIEVETPLLGKLLYKAKILK